MANLATAKKAIPIDVVVGRIGLIRLDIAGVEAGPLSLEDPESPIALEFRNSKTGFYIVIYDHRRAVRQAFDQGDDAFQLAFEKTVPCVGGFRLKENRQYIVLADLGTPDIHDGGPDECLVLTRYDGAETKQRFRVCSFPGHREPIHRDTKIAICEFRRPA